MGKETSCPQLSFVVAQGRSEVMSCSRTTCTSAAKSWDSLGKDGNTCRAVLGSDCWIVWACPVRGNRSSLALLRSPDTWPAQHWSAAVPWGSCCHLLLPANSRWSSVSFGFSERCGVCLVVCRVRRVGDSWLQLLGLSINFWRTQGRLPP